MAKRINVSFKDDDPKDNAAYQEIKSKFDQSAYVKELVFADIEAKKESKQHDNCIDDDGILDILR